MKPPPFVRPKTSWRRLLLGGLALASLSLGGCSKQTILPVKDPKACEVQFVSLTVLATDRINPTVRGEPRPVQLRIYQLRDDIRIQSEAFRDVWKRDKKTLGKDIIKKDEIFVYPESRTEVKFERAPDAQYVVGAAIFRNPKGRSWYTSFELPPAPGKGDCTLPDCEDGDEECRKRRVNPHFALLVDGARVDDGAGHEEDGIGETRTRVIYLSKGSPKGQAKEGGEGKSGGEKAAPQGEGNRERNREGEKKGE